MEISEDNFDRDVDFDMVSPQNSKQKAPTHVLVDDTINPCVKR